jgi:hypothetical protein
MNHEKSKTPGRRRRNCYDRLRARMLEARRRRRADPATTAVMQLVTLFATIFGRMPLVSNIPMSAYTAPPLSPSEAHRRQVARRLGIPTRYVDIVLAQGTVPYPILFEHIRRGGKSRDDALSVLRQRAPEACRDWLDHVADWGLWSELLLCHVHNGLDEDTDIKLLKSTLAWLEGQNSEEGIPGPVGAGAPVMPGIGPGDPEPEDDPKPPKP